jgi:hypothetical protein
MFYYTGVTLKSKDRHLNTLVTKHGLCHNCLDVTVYSNVYKIIS